MSRKKTVLPDNVAEIGKDHNKSEYRREQAYKKLGISPDDVVKVPKISHILKKIKGGNTEAVELLRHSQDTKALEFFKVYEDIPSYLAELLPIEAFCFAAGVDSRDICKIIFNEALDQSNQAARMLTAANLEDLVQVSIDTGKAPLGIKDRENLQKAIGFLPIPDGMKINIHNNNSATATASAQSSAAVATLPPAEETIRRMSTRFNERFIGSEKPQAALPEGEQEEIFIPPIRRECVPVMREGESEED